MNAFIWALLAASIWGIVPLLEKLGLAKVEPLVGVFYRSLGVVVGLLLLGAFMLKPQQIKAIDLRSAGFLILGGFLASILAQICFYNSLKIGEVSRVVPISGSYPLIAFMLGMLILGESVSLIKAAGALLIVLGIWALKMG
ncbi:MAG: EamA family transporter [Candidatus Omnitrophica bacterium]|nr:EamA family transporter [Candidatus Omnitrophota bacterium]MBU1871952.1 EamA family transporter [Candidatus Omnitrophota bacterium]